MTADESPRVSDRSDPLVASSHGLTDEQASAMALDRHLAVTAAAGTGKTTALTARYLHILQRTSATPEEILTVTFTRKATKEMNDRIRENITAKLATVDDQAAFTRWRMIADTLEDGYIQTIDAFCARILREYAVAAGVDPGFETLDEVDAGVLQREAITRVLDRDDHSDAHQLAARLWGREVLIELVRGLLAEQPTSTEWAANRADIPIGEFRSLLFDAFCECPPDTARETLTSPDVQDALAVIRDIDPAALDVARDDYGRQHLDTHLTAAAGMPGAIGPQEASNIEVLRALRRLYNGLTNSSGDLYNSAHGRGSHYLVGTKGNWPSDSHTRLRDALGALLDALGPHVDAIQTIPDTVDDNSLEYVRALARLYQDCVDEYETLKSRRTAYDFNDLLTQVLELLRTNPEIEAELQDQFAHIMVDEFQDTDPQQWELVQRLANINEDADPDAGASVFVVGDKKQSIYRFRGADVATFSQARADLATANLRRSDVSVRTGGTDPPTEVELTGSFRTLASVVDFLNPVFDSVFQPAGDEYQPFEAEPQRLNTKRVEGTDIDGRVEYLFVPETNDTAELVFDDDHPLYKDTYLGTGDREATALAAKVTAHLDAETEVYDEEGSTYRPIEPKDIAVLLRTRRHLEAYERAFDEYGIELTVVSGAGYWDTSEIRMATNLIEVLYDTSQDIHLYGLLRSPLFGCADADIAELAAGDASLWDELSATDDPTLSEVYDTLSRWRALYGYTGDAEGDSPDTETTTTDVPPDKLFSQVFEDTGVLASLGAGPRGKQAVANLEKFRDQLRSWGMQGNRTIPALRDRIKRQQKEDGDEQNAHIPDSDDGVKLLTVHSAKGLEFPFVAVPELGRGFNLDGTVDEYRQAHLEEYEWTPRESETPLSEPFIGITAPKLEDPYTTSGTRARSALQADHREELRAEEKRVLYVACTRARDHLLLSSTHDLVKTADAEDGGSDDREAETSPGERAFEATADEAEAGQWLDWLQPVLLDDHDELVPKLLTDGEATARIEDATYTVSTPPAKTEWDSAPSGETATVTPAFDTASTSTEAATHVTATTLVHLLEEHDSIPGRKPFISPEFTNVATPFGELIQEPSVRDRISGNTLGTIIHRTCEFAPFDSIAERQATIERVVNGLEESLEDSQRDFVEAHVNRALDFQADLIAGGTAHTIRTELPVRVRVGAREIIGEIDFLLITPETVHIVDYKSNRITDLERDVPRLTAKYRPQLETYATALQTDYPDREIVATLMFTTADTARLLRFPPANESSEADRPRSRLQTYLDLLEDI